MWCLAVVIVSLGAVAAVPAGPVTAQEGGEPSAAQRCFAHHNFGREPVDVAKTADGETVLAQANWGYHQSIGCYLTLNGDALAALRAAPLPNSLPDTATEASKRCFGHHKFGERPVDVAKTADHRTVIARLSWNWHDSIGCYLTLDNTALATLRAAATVPQFTAIAAGWRHTCGLRTDGIAQCWGNNEYGQSDPPDGVSFTAITTGHWHTCGLRTDSTAQCWGGNWDGQSDAPDGKFTAITATVELSCGLRTDGTAQCWGDYWAGLFDAPDGKFTAISAGFLRSCVLRTDGTAECWGSAWDAPAGVSFTAISAGGYHSCGLRADGTAQCWGENDSGQLDPPAVVLSRG